MLNYRLGFNSSLTPDYSKSDGIILVDSNNIKHVDLFSNFSSLPFGHNFPPLIEFLDLYKPLLSERVPICAFNQHFVDRFTCAFSKLLPSSFCNISFAENGGMAVEQVIKSFLYLSYISEKKVVFYVFEGSYHGIVGLSSCLTRAAIPSSERLKYLPQSNLEVRCITDLCTFESLNIDSDADNVFFAEPIRCTMGDNPLSKSSINLLRDVSLYKNCYVVYDEIQSGFFSTLNTWAHESFSLPTPDVVIFGKRSQICGFASSNILSSVFADNSPKILSSTFDGSLLDFTTGFFFSQYLPKFISSNKENLELLSSELASLLKITLNAVSFRSFGTLIALVFIDQSCMLNASSFLTSRRILHNPTYPNTIRFRIPFNFSSSDIHLLEELI